MNKDCCFGLVLLCAAAGIAPAAAAAANALSIKASQPLGNVTLRSRAPAAVSPDEAARSSSEQATLIFQAYGRTFNLDLERNDRLTDSLDASTKARVGAQIKAYRGRLMGNSASWVRINQIGDKLSGMIWDGKEIFVIDPSEDIAAAAAIDNKQKSRPMIYRLKDATWNARCALEPNLRSLSDYDALLEELRSRAQTLPQGQGELALPAAIKELSVAVVADPLFVQANSTDPQAAVVARMNVVDGIYAGQVGVQLKLSSVLPLNANGTLTSTAPSTLLGQFGNYTAGGSFTNPGIAHLFTGRDLDGSTVGIAYLGSLCSSRFSVGVSQMVGVGTVGALIAAHEIGHNFGAPHDNQSGSACASSPSGFIMNPSVSASANTFSSCSLAQMAPTISAAACVRAGTGGGGGGTGATSISVTPTSAAAGSSVTASWSGIANASPTNWIGLYVPGAASQNHNGNWMYVSCSKTPGATLASGSCAFPLPSNLTAGSYEVRLHASASWTAIATSPRITITGGTVNTGTTLSVSPSSIARGSSVTVTWSGITNLGATNWIGLHLPGAASWDHQGNWMYVSCTKTPTVARASGSCSFPIPTTLAPGTYQMRLHAPASWTAITVSGALTVQ